MTKLVNITERMRADIAGGVLKLGQRITINELAEQYEIGQMPVREAVRRLLGEELLQRVPGAGTRVRQITGRYISEFIAVTNAIQAVLVRAAAERCQPADIDALRAIEGERCAMVAARDYAAALQLNHDFHDRIHAIAQNDHGSKLLERNRVLMLALWHRYGYGPGRLAGVENDHLNILRALARNDADAAASLATAHSLKAKFELLERVEQEEAERGAD